MKSLTFAITGANGQVGAFLVDYLRQQGHVVYELVRSIDKAKDKNYYLFFDLSKPQQVPSLDGIDVLIHSAYFFDVTHVDYTYINIVGTQKLFQQATTYKVHTALFISTLSAHSAAQSLYGQTKYKIEKMLQAEHQSLIIIRPGLILHTPLKGIVGAIDRFIQKFPIVPLIGMGKQRIYPCLLNELAQCVLSLSTQQRNVTKPIITASYAAITLKELSIYLAAKRRKNIIFLPIPFFGFYFMLKVVEYLKLNIGIHSDNLLGLHYANDNIDFSDTEALGFHFSSLEMFLSKANL